MISQRRTNKASTIPWNTSKPHISGHFLNAGGTGGTDCFIPNLKLHQFLSVSQAELVHLHESHFLENKDDNNPQKKKKKKKKSNFQSRCSHVFVQRERESEDSEKARVD